MSSNKVTAPLKRSSVYSRIWIMSWFINWQENKVLARTSPAAVWQEPAASSCDGGIGSFPPRHTSCSSIPRPVLRPVGLYLPGLHNIHSSQNWVTSTKNVPGAKLHNLKMLTGSCGTLHTGEQMVQHDCTCLYLRYIQHLNFFYGLCTESTRSQLQTHADLRLSGRSEVRFSHTPLPWWRWPLSAILNI